MTPTTSHHAPGRAALVLLLGSALAGVLAAGPGAAQAPDPPATLRLGSDPWPPFTGRSQDPRVALDLVEAALARVGRPVETEIRDDFAAVWEAIRTGELDGSAALWRTAEREVFLHFSRPYLENRLVVLARKGTDVEVKRLADLAKRKVAIVEGYSYGSAVEADETVRWVRGASDQANVDALLRGDVDYVLADELLVHDLFRRYGERASGQLVAGREAIVERSLHLALRREVPDAQSVLAAFDRAIDEMLEDGTFHAILGVRWLRVDLDGDGRHELVLRGSRAGEKAPQRGYSVLTPGSTDADAIGDLRVHIDGKTYESWKDVPKRYKVPPETPTEPAQRSPGLRLLEF